MKSDLSTERLDRPALEKVARLFGAFADGTRLAILQELKDQALPVGELVNRLGTSQSNISKQLHLLFEAGLLAREKRGNQVFYSIADRVVFQLCEIACDKLNREAQAAVGVNFQI